MLQRRPHLFIYKINNLKMRTLHLENNEPEKDIIGVEDYTIVENKIIVTRYLNYDINFSIENPGILKLLLNDKKELAIKMIDLLYTDELEAIKQQIIISKRPKTYKKSTIKQESLKDVLFKYFVKFDKFPNECDATIDNLFSLDYFKTNEKYKKYKTFIENCRTIKPFIYNKMTYQDATDLYYKKYLNQLKKNPNKNK